jgi:hypothetical protein
VSLVFNCFISIVILSGVEGSLLASALPANKALQLRICSDCWIMLFAACTAAAFS